jgi:hypothetical protein
MTEHPPADFCMGGAINERDHNHQDEYNYELIEPPSGL